MSVSVFKTVVSTELDYELFQAQNRLRTNPASFLPWIKAQWRNFDKRMYSMLRKTAKAIQNQMKEPSLDPLEWEEGLALAARDHCNDIGPKGALTHIGTDDTTPFDRTAKYAVCHVGGKEGDFGESLYFGPYKNAMKIIFNLLMGYGQKNMERIWS